MLTETNINSFQRCSKYIYKTICYTLLSLGYSRGEKADLQSVVVEKTTEKDKSRYMEIMNNPAVIENHTGKYSTPQNQAKNNSIYWNNKKYAQHDCYKMYKILYNNQIVGYIEFFNDNTNKEIAYIAYSLDPKYWNRGIVTIAIKKLLKEVTGELRRIGVKKIHATVRITNKGSIRVLQKNGFVIIEEKFFSNCPIKILELNLD